MIATVIALPLLGGACQLFANIQELNEATDASTTSTATATSTAPEDGGPNFCYEPAPDAAGGCFAGTWPAPPATSSIDGAAALIPQFTVALETLDPGYG